MDLLLWKIRDAKGVTLRELEQMSGIPRSTINDIENNRMSPRLVQMEALAKALGVRIGDLFDSEYK